MASPALADKVIVIIGGTAGLGLSAAKACVAEGAAVVALGHERENADAAQGVLGNQARVLVGDARDPVAVQRCFAEALSAFGRCDGLYHVAGGSGRRFGDGPLHEMTDEGWETTLALNLTSVMISNRAALRLFDERGTGGAILNLSSVLAFSPSPAFFATHAYATAKAGIIGLSRAAAAHYTGKNIRINVLAPALVETPMSQRAASDSAICEFIGRKQPLDGGRIGQPADLDAAVVYLLSDAARFVTGQVLSVDGGWGVSEGLPARST